MLPDQARARQGPQTIRLLISGRTVPTTSLETGRGNRRTAGKAHTGKGPEGRNSAPDYRFRRWR